jgi:hypothetical protein
MHLWDKHQVVRTDLEDTCLGALYLKLKFGVQQHCKFETRLVSELVYKISDADHLVFSPSQKVHKMTCKNGTQTVFHLEQALKIHVYTNCKVKLQKHHHF